MDERCARWNVRDERRVETRFCRGKDERMRINERGFLSRGGRLTLYISLDDDDAYAERSRVK
jgi:hypothetical protein